MHSTGSANQAHHEFNDHDKTELEAVPSQYNVFIRKEL